MIRELYFRPNLKKEEEEEDDPFTDITDKTHSLKRAHSIKAVQSIKSIFENLLNKSYYSSI